MEWLDFLVLLIPIAVSWLAYRRQSLNGAGAVAAFALSAILYLSGGLRFLFILLAFFVSSTVLTRWKGEAKKPLEDELYEKNGTRDLVQVAANGGAALLAALLYIMVPMEFLAVAVFGAFAACNADTWASEIGILSRKDPISILTFKPIQRGMSGGISSLGLAASLAGAFFIGLLYIPFHPSDTPWSAVLARVAIITAVGFLGSLIDSFLGASLQVSYKNAKSGRLTEKRYTQLTRNLKEKGLNWLNNDMVNFISSTLAMTAGILVTK